MKPDDPFDPERLRLRNAPAASPTPSPARAKRVEHIHVPIPWFKALAGTSVGAHRLALYLLHRKFRRHTQTIRLPNGDLAGCGVNRHAKRRALRELELAGLVVVEGRVGKSPLVTLLGT